MNKERLAEIERLYTFDPKHPCGWTFKGDVGDAIAAVPELLAALAERDKEVERLNRLLTEVNAHDDALRKRLEETGADEPGFIAELSALRSRCEKLESGFLADVMAEVARARAKFPGNKQMTAALMEEVGELANALLEHDRHGDTAEHVYREAVQVACVAMRIAEEGTAECKYQGRLSAAKEGE